MFYRGNATKENIQRMGFEEGQVIFKCPKCCSIKPDRAHHCSVCQRWDLWSILRILTVTFLVFRCIKKMDHHCPWVNNCVGERNQKFFVLFTLYIGLMSYHRWGHSNDNNGIIIRKYKWVNAFQFVPGHQPFYKLHPRRLEDLPRLLPASHGGLYTLPPVRGKIQFNTRPLYCLLFKTVLA